MHALLIYPILLVRSLSNNHDFLFLIFYIQIIAKSWQYQLLNIYLDLLNATKYNHHPYFLLPIPAQWSSNISLPYVNYLPYIIFSVFFLPWLLIYYFILFTLPFLNVFLLSFFVSSFQSPHILHVVFFSVLPEASLFIFFTLSLCVLFSFLVSNNN